MSKLSPGQIMVDPIILTFAVRYALARRSTAAADVIANVSRRMLSLDRETAARVVLLIDDAHRAEKLNKIDEQRWLRLMHDLVKAHDLVAAKT